MGRSSSSAPTFSVPRAAAGTWVGRPSRPAILCVALGIGIPEARDLGITLCRGIGTVHIKPSLLVGRTSCPAAVFPNTQFHHCSCGDADGSSVIEESNMRKANVHIHRIKFLRSPLSPLSIYARILLSLWARTGSRSAHDCR